MSGGALCPRLVQQTHCTARTVCQLASPLSIDDVQTGSRRMAPLSAGTANKRKHRVLCVQKYRRLEPWAANYTHDCQPPQNSILLPYLSSPLPSPLPLLSTPFSPTPSSTPLHTLSMLLPTCTGFPARHPNNAGRPIKAIKPHITWCWYQMLSCYLWRTLGERT